MDNIEEEKNIEGYPKSVSLKGTETILEQMKKKVCKICVGNGAKGTGFFCKIPYPDENNLLPVLITNNHVINQSILQTENKRISLTINNIDKEIILDNRLKYTNKTCDITIIEIKKQDRIEHYLELDDNLKNKSNLSYIGESIYILHYPRSGDIFVSYGLIKEEINKYDFKHLCSTDNGSSGGPILNLSNNKIIGVHKAALRQEEYNIGFFLKYPIQEFNDFFKEKTNEEIKESNKNYNLDDDNKEIIELDLNEEKIEEEEEINKKNNNKNKDLDVISLCSNKSDIKVFFDKFFKIIDSFRFFDYGSREKLENYIEYLNLYNVIFIPFLGIPNHVKNKLINKILGKNILINNLDEYMRKGIIIKYSKEEEITLSKAYIKHKNFLQKTNCYFNNKKKLGKGEEQIKEAIKEELKIKEKEVFFYLKSKIKLFDEIGFDDSIKNMVYLIFFPFEETQDILEFKVYKEVLSICNIFVFFFENSLFKDDISKKIFNSNFNKVKDIKNELISKFIKSSLFVLNNDEEILFKKDFENIKKNIKEILKLNNKEINLCSVNDLKESFSFLINKLYQKKHNEFDKNFSNIMLFLKIFFKFDYKSKIKDNPNEIKNFNLNINQVIEGLESSQNNNKNKMNELFNTYKENIVQLKLIENNDIKKELEKNNLEGIKDIIFTEMIKIFEYFIKRINEHLNNYEDKSYNYYSNAKQYLINFVQEKNNFLNLNYKLKEYISKSIGDIEKYFEKEYLEEMKNSFVLDLNKIGYGKWFASFFSNQSYLNNIIEIGKENFILKGNSISNILLELTNEYLEVLIINIKQIKIFVSRFENDIPNKEREFFEEDEDEESEGSTENELKKLYDEYKTLLIKD